VAARLKESLLAIIELKELNFVMTGKQSKEMYLENFIQTILMISKENNQDIREKTKRTQNKDATLCIEEDCI